MKHKSVFKGIVVMGLVFGAFVGSASNLFAYRMALSNLQGMTDKADRIFVGVPTYRQEGDLTIGEVSIPYIEYRFKVNDVIKGHIHGNLLVVRQVDLKRKMQIAPSFDLVPMPEYALDQEVILFLGKDSSIGFTGPVAMSQAVFHLQTIDHHKFVKNHMGRRLIPPKDKKAQAPLTSEGTKITETKIGDLIPYEDFLSLVGEMQGNHGNH